MLEKFGFDSPESLKRFLVMLVGPLLAFVNSTFHFGVPDVVVVGLLGLLASYIWQSMHKQVQLANQAAEAAKAGITNLADAKAYLAARPTPPVGPPEAK